MGHFVFARIWSNMPSIISRLVPVMPYLIDGWGRRAQVGQRTQSSLREDLVHWDGPVAQSRALVRRHRHRIAVERALMEEVCDHGAIGADLLVLGGAQHAVRGGDDAGDLRL